MDNFEEKVAAYVEDEMRMDPSLDRERVEARVREILQLEATIEANKIAARKRMAEAAANGSEK